MLPRERLDYAPIEGRPPLRLPEGVRLVLWPVLALEEWDIARTVIPPPQGQPLLPDVPNWTWHEYGMRVGFWRLKRMYERLRIAPTVTLNAKVCETYPPVVEACVKNGWELNAHSFEQIPMQRLDDEPAVIRRSIETIEKFSGTRPRGWFGPGLTQTERTLDHLAEAGIEYIGDWVLDDEPVTLRTTSRPVGRPAPDPSRRARLRDAPGPARRGGVGRRAHPRLVRGAAAARALSRAAVAVARPTAP